MLIGHLISPEAISQLDPKRLDELTEVAMKAFVENTIIDEEIRKNPVIMKELSAVVARSLKPNELRK